MNSQTNNALRLGGALTLSLALGGSFAAPHSNSQLHSARLQDLLAPKDATKATTLQPIRSTTSTWNCPVLVVGGGTGGIAAALAAAQSGTEVFLLEETEWLGGQTTVGGVSTPDEPGKPVDFEGFGGTARHYAFRNGVRDYYLNNYRLRSGVSRERFSPGKPWVSRFGFEPKVGDNVLKQMVEPLVKAGKLHIFYKTRAVACTMNAEGDTITAVTARTADGKLMTFQAQYVLDATETGDLLPLCGKKGIDFEDGSESQAQTGEPDAPEMSHRNWIQPFTFPFALSISPATRSTNVIARPKDYDRIKKQQHFTFKDGCITGIFKGGTPWWTYRRILAKENFQDARIQSDIAMINVETNDYRGDQMERLLTGTYEERQAFLQEARQVSLAYVYWLQTECPREDDPTGRKVGYPEFRLCKEQFGTPDGLSVIPYIREGRRIIPLRRIVEQDIVVRDMQGHAWQTGPRAAFFSDSIGIGFYAMDIHTTGHGEKHAYAATRPFQIPLSAMIPAHLKNLLPASHDLGTTHLTNGAYRLHPIEWNIGESAGLLATYCVRTGATPRQVDENRALLRDYQDTLLANGIALYWFDDVPQTHSAFASVQRLALAGFLKGNGQDLHFQPGLPVTGKEWATWRAECGKIGGEKVPVSRAAAMIALDTAQRNAKEVAQTSQGTALLISQR